jgi:hypothetical protein
VQPEGREPDLATTIGLDLLAAAARWLDEPLTSEPAAARRVLLVLSEPAPVGAALGDPAEEVRLGILIGVPRRGLPRIDTWARACRLEAALRGRGWRVETRSGLGAGPATVGLALLARAARVAGRPDLEDRLELHFRRSLAPGRHVLAELVAIGARRP